MVWWFLIPIVAILMGGFTEWLKFKEKQLKLGNTADSLSGDLEALTKRLEESSEFNARLQERVKNLEAIVTTQMWDDSVDSAPKQLERPAPRLEIPEEESSDEEKARILARRIRH